MQCTSCHAPTNTNFAQFECISCHRHAQDLIDPLHTTVSAYRYASDACYSCHPTPAGKFDPTQNVAVTALVPTWSNATIVSLTPTDESLPMRMNHAAPQPDGARGACANCHVNAALADFYPGQFHGSLHTLMLPQPTECADCHASSSPIGFVGPIASTAPRTPPSGRMKHDAVAWANGAPTATPLVRADCSTCHVAPSILSAATWTTSARFHDALSATAQPQPASCIDCHANTRPGPQHLTSANSTLPPNVEINHFGPVWLGDCGTCHLPAFSSWAGGKFHLDAGAPPPATCLPCHALGRPASNDGGLRDPPFDFGTNAQGVTHGAGQDCAVCHRPLDWTTGNFAHGPSTVSGTTCVACHSTQRPTIQGDRCDAGLFDHASSGTGDCFGCHQGTSAFTQLGDWACGLRYPGPNLISSTNQFIRVNTITLRRGGPNNLVTATTSTQATLYNAMLHTSGAVPSDAGIAPGPTGDPATCWHCHTSTPGTTLVVSFVDGQFHGALDNYRSTPDAGTTPLAQPAANCADCHSNMRPTGIVQPDAGTLSVLQPMDHHAKVDGGASIAALDCSVCHARPGASWSDGAFHSKVPSTDQDCTVCHYTLMADGPKVDVISAASPSFQMKHRSSQLKVQKCDQCHRTALANATGSTNAALWAPGTFHPNLTAQPTACVDCHAATAPTHASQSALNGQWMNHVAAVVTARDCAFCHASDARPVGSAWSTSTRFHVPGISPTTCQSCHGAANGGAGNNVPAGLIDSTTITSAGTSTGRAGLNVQLSHADSNVTARDCNFCHTAPGQDWRQASFHERFTGGVALVGQCSSCHLNLKPAATFSPNHSAFGDCSSCHAWPGTGGASAPNWHRATAASAPPTISVGGFTIAQPPAANGSTLQAGLNNLPHPAVPAGATCTTCHSSASGGRGAHGYDHALAPATGCASCHEAGSDLLGTPWTLNAPGATQVAAQCGRGGGTIADRGGDTRPVGITSLACSSRAASLTCGTQSCVLNHFYPSDCGECHVKPAASPATVTTGASYVGRWRFQHFFGAPAQQATCCHCHGPPSCRP